MRTLFYFFAAALLVIGFVGVSHADALTVSTDASFYVNPATVYFSTTGGPQINVYKGATGMPIANTTGTRSNVTLQTLNGYSWDVGSFSGTVNGTYQVVAVDNASCNGSSYSACLAANPGASQAIATFEIGSTTPVTYLSATSTKSNVDQSSVQLYAVAMAAATFTFFIVRIVGALFGDASRRRTMKSTRTERGY